MSTTSFTLCRCGHPRQTHQHYRAGSDCGICGVLCLQFKAQRRRYRAAKDVGMALSLIVVGYFGALLVLS